MSEQHEIKINLPGLLKILGSNIYAEPDVAVREMIQNAHDTCIIRKTKDDAFDQPKIHISFDKPAKTLTISDNGAGMTEDELHNYLSTIGEGFTKVQKDDLRGANAQEALLLIGQFGLGLLSAFSVADKVEVFTRSFREGASGFQWTCEGDIHYTVEPAKKAEPGTEAVLHLTKANLVLLDETRLRQAVKKYADFLSVPIYLGGNQANSCTAPWERDDEKFDYADYIQARYGLLPLGVIPFARDEPVHLSGLLFVPMTPFELSRDLGEVDIFISRMFIKENDKGLLPGWARFVKGVINTPDLTPTVSRDDIVRDENYKEVRALLGEIVLQYLALLEENAPDKLSVLVGAYNNTIKARALEDDDFFDRICDLARVSTDTERISMIDYLVQSKGTIYYFSERGTGTQHKLLFAHKGLPVIDASWGVEEEFLEKYAERKGVPIERLEMGSGVIFKILETADEKWEDLERQFKLRVKREARAVSFEPETVPAVLVARPMERDDKKLAEADALATQLGISSEKIRRMFDKASREKAGRAAGDATVLQINTSNPLMRLLREMPRNDTFYLALTAVYNNANMFAHHYVSPQNAEIIFETNNTAISTMITSALSLEELQGANARMEIELDILQRRMGQVKLSEYRSCFFAYPFQDQFHALRDRIRRLLAEEHGIRLTATSIEMKDPSVVNDIKGQIAAAHFGIADITGNNPNVMWELGVMIGYHKPVIILKDKTDKEETPFDLYGNYRVPYQVVKDGATGDVEYPLLKKGLDRNLKLVFERSPELEKAELWSESS